MPRRLIATLLMLILIAPINAVAAASMVVTISAEQGMTSAHQLSHAGHGGHAMHAPEQLSSMSATHDHNADDCDDYCMSCSNHCSSSAIVSSSKNTFELDREFEYPASAHTLSRAYLLFRPPIRV